LDCSIHHPRLKKRKEFEDTVRRVGRWSLGVWAKVRQQCVGDGADPVAEG